ncbi:MAG: hypothetical protein IJE78_08405 [Bacteroidaceae bacterium]|nr:hypothetical protein [Bacteroidaceae bacterium]
MRKLTYTMALTALMLAGCSQEENLNTGEEVKVTFTANLSNGIQSRTDGEAETSPVMVDKMIFAVYTNDGSKRLIYQESDVNENGEAKFSSTLLKGECYDIVFWAYKSTNNTCYDLTNFPLVKFNPTNSTAIDAYTVREDNYVISGGNISVTLKRPLAQINFAENLNTWSNALELFGNKTPVLAKLKVYDCPTSYNALTGEIEGSETADYTYSFTPNTSTILLTDTKNTEDVNDDVKYFALASGYVLGETTVSCGVDLFDESQDILYSFSVPNVPAKPNYRTNIYGNLLMSTTSYTVTVNVGYETNKTNKTPEELVASGEQPDGSGEE